MKKMVKTLLCLMMALAMSLSLAVPAFAASTVSKETCSHNTGGSYVGQVRTAEAYGDATECTPATVFVARSAIKTIRSTHRNPIHWRSTRTGVRPKM